MCVYVNLISYLLFLFRVNTVRVCLNLYSKRVPLIPSRLSTLSKHLLVNLYAKSWKVGALWHLDSISTGKSVMPSLIYTRLKMDFMGRQLTLAEVWKISSILVTITSLWRAVYILFRAWGKRLSLSFNYCFSFLNHPWSNLKLDSITLY